MVVVRLCLNHSNGCAFTKNMIKHATMGTIRRPSDSGSMDTETIAFIQFINGCDTQMNKLWWLGLYWSYFKFHTSARVEIRDGTVIEFVTD